MTRLKPGPAAALTYLARLAFAAALSVLGAAALLSPAAHAGELRVRPEDRQKSASIPRAMEIFITPRGQGYFENNLVDIVSRNGFELTDGGFSDWPYNAQEPIDLYNLPVHMQPFSSTLGQLRDTVAKYLSGFNFQNPLIHADVSNISYTAKFNKFGIRVDPEGTRNLGGGGVAFVFEASAPEIKVMADFAHANDLNNPFLGMFGANQIWAKIQPDSAPLNARLPLSLQVSGGQVEFHAMTPQINLTDLSLDMDYKSPLLLPTAALIVNGKRMNVRQPQLEKELRSQKPQLLKALQAYLDHYATDEVPPTITRLVTDETTLILSDVNKINPPGAGPNVSPDDRYNWGVHPEQFRMVDDNLQIGLSAYVDDPKSATPSAQVSRLLTTCEPAIRLSGSAPYDAAIVVNEDLVNRFIGLGYKRGYFPTLDVSGGSPLTLLAAPEFRFDGQSGDRGKLHLKVSHKMSGLLEEIAARGQVSFEMDADARLVHTAQGKISVVVDGIDVNTQSPLIDYGTVRSPFKGQVHDTIVSEIRAENQKLASSPTVIVDSLPIPSSIKGIPIEISDFRADPNGYIVIYVTFNMER